MLIIIIWHTVKFITGVHLILKWTFKVMLGQEIQNKE